MMRSLTAFLGSVAALASVAACGHGATLAFYDLETGRGSSDSDSSSTAGPLHYDADDILVTVTANVGNPGSAVSYITRATNIGDAKLREPAILLSLAPAAGYELNLDALATDFAAMSSGTAGYAAQLAVFTSLDNFTDPIHFNLAADSTGTSSPNAPGPYSSVSSPGMSFNPGLYHHVTTPVEFRIYPFGNSVEFALIDNLRITGTTSVVPEPIGLAAAGVMLVVGSCRARRR